MSKTLFPPSLHERNQSSLTNLITSLAKIPGLGTRSAKRMVYHLLGAKDQSLNQLIDKLTYLRDHARPCQRCFNICFAEICDICANPNRDQNLLCVVEKPQNVEAIEKSAAYHGRYHVIGGLLSVFDGITPEDLNIEAIRRRITEENIKEVIFALPATQDGRTTLHMITDMLLDMPVQISIPAQGMPLGSDIDYLDQGTLMTAFKGRKPL
ncbi:MAG: recombination mediator RecR [Pseudomonadota bacterium]